MKEKSKSYLKYCLLSLAVIFINLQLVSCTVDEIEIHNDQSIEKNLLQQRDSIKTDVNAADTPIIPPILPVTVPPGPKP